MKPALPGCWDDLVVVCAGTPWGGIWFPEKHVANRLTMYAPVLYVDPPMSPLAGRNGDVGQATALEGPRLRLLRPSLARFTPVVLPAMHRLGMPEVNEFLARRLLHHAVGRLTSRVRAVVVAAPNLPFGVAGEQLKVLYATDDFVAGATLMGLSEDQLRRTQARQAATVDAVIAVSPTLVDKWRALGHDPTLIPNGCDVSLFATTDDALLPDDVHLPPPVAGFIGHLSDRIELTLLEAVADRGCSLLLVGPRQGTFEMARVDRLLMRPNVHWTGPRRFETLPSYLRMIDVGLTPYGDTPFNRASFPLKTLEYLAGGRAVVATDLPAVRWLNTDLITIASGQSRFADAVDAALALERTPELVRRRRQFASHHSWEERTRQFADVVCATSPGSRSDDVVS